MFVNRKSNAKETGKDHTVGDAWDEPKKAEGSSHTSLTLSMPIFHGHMHVTENTVWFREITV